MADGNREGFSPEDLGLHPGSTTGVLGPYQVPSPLPSPQPQS